MTQHCLGKAPKDSPRNRSSAATTGEQVPQNSVLHGTSSPCPLPCFFSSFVTFPFSGVTTATVLARRGRQYSPPPFSKQQVKAVLGRVKYSASSILFTLWGTLKRDRRWLMAAIIRSEDHFIVPRPTASCICRT